MLDEIISIFKEGQILSYLRNNTNLSLQHKIR